MNVLTSELFQSIEKAQTYEDKVRILKTNDYPIVRALFTLNYNPDFKMLLPEGVPPYRKDVDKPIGYNETTLQLELKRFYIWMDPNINISKIKKESLFIEMLEGLHFSEAEVLCAAKDKTLSNLYPSLTEDLARDAFPGIFPFPPSPKKETVPTKKSRSKKLSN